MSPSLKYNSVYNGLYPRIISYLNFEPFFLFFPFIVQQLFVLANLLIHCWEKHLKWTDQMIWDFVWFLNKFPTIHQCWPCMLNVRKENGKHGKVFSRKNCVFFLICEIKTYTNYFFPDFRIYYEIKIQGKISGSRTFGNISFGLSQFWKSLYLEES